MACLCVCGWVCLSACMRECVWLLNVVIEGGVHPPRCCPPWDAGACWFQGAWLSWSLTCSLGGPGWLGSLPCQGGWLCRVLGCLTPRDPDLGLHWYGRPLVEIATHGRWSSGSPTLWLWPTHLGIPSFSCWDGHTEDTPRYVAAGLR